MRIPFCCLKFCFPAGFVLYIKCSVDKGCIQPRFLMSIEITKVYLDLSAVCNELLAVLKLAVGLLNICTLNITTVRKPETQF